MEKDLYLKNLKYINEITIPKLMIFFNSHNTFKSKLMKPFNYKLSLDFILKNLKLSSDLLTSKLTESDYENIDEQIEEQINIYHEKSHDIWYFTNKILLNPYYEYLHEKNNLFLLQKNKKRCFHEKNMLNQFKKRNHKYLKLVKTYQSIHIAVEPYLMKYVA